MKRAFSKSRALFSGIFVLILTLLIACSSAPSPAIKATEEFYINDRPKSLLNSTRWTILTYSEELYDYSRAEPFVNDDISGTQIVVATYIGNVGDFSSTDLFNSWGIGDNDMGILMILFFEKGEEDFGFKNIVFEIGARMAGYLSAHTASNLVAEHFYDPEVLDFDYDQKLINLYFAVQEHIYFNVYNDTFDIQEYLEEYEENKYEYFGLLPSEQINDLIFPVWVWVIIVIVSLLFGVTPGGIFLFGFFRRGGQNKGGGGRSGGYWFHK